MSFLTSVFRPANLRLWLLIIALIKVTLFMWFTTQFRAYWEPELISEGFVVHSGDTPGYFVPAEDVARGNGYTSQCRMPGVVPIYSPVSFFFGSSVARMFFVIAQLVLTIISTWLLARITYALTHSWLAFRITALLYALSSFVSIWDHVLYSDSFSVSFMILSVWLLYRYQDKRKFSYIAWSAFFIGWSAFFRPVMVVLFPPLLLFIIWSVRGLGMRVIAISAASFLTPILLMFGSWTWYNSYKFNQPILLTQPINKCFLKPELEEIALLVIAWGENYISWYEGSSASWLLKPGGDQSISIPERVYVNGYNADSLVVLKANYKLFLDSANTPVGESAGNRVIDSCRRFKALYKQGKPFDYYVLNRLRLLRIFLFPAQLDNLPGPAFSEMGIHQKLIKGGYFLLFLITNLSALVSTIWILIFRREYFFPVMLAGTLLIVLSLLLGFIEPRYFAPIYCWSVLLAALPLDYLLRKRFKQS